MWQFQWMMSLLPDSWLFWIYLTITAIGAVLYFGSKLLRWPPFKWIPMIGQYPLVSELLGIIMLVGGIFLFGGLATEMSWRDKVAQLEAKIAIAEEKSKDANNKLNEVVKSKTKVIHDTKVITKEKLKVVEKLIDKECKVPKEAVDIHNDAAKAPEVGDIVIKSGATK